MVFERRGCVAKSSTKVPTLPPTSAKGFGGQAVSRLALALKSSFSLARLFFNGLLSPRGGSRHGNRPGNTNHLTFVRGLRI